MVFSGKVWYQIILSNFADHPSAVAAATAVAAVTAAVAVATAVAAVTGQPMKTHVVAHVGAHTSVQCEPSRVCLFVITNSFGF